MVGSGGCESLIRHRFTLDMGKWGQQPCEVLAVEPGSLLSYSFATSKFANTAHSSPDHPGPGRMKSGPYWRVARWTIRRFLLRDGFVMAAAAIDPPWPPLLRGGRLRNIRGGKSPSLNLQVFNRPPWPPCARCGKLGVAPV